MAQLRQGLLDEQAGMKASEDARKLRDAKKFGKKVQQERIKEREMDKKRMKEGVEGLKKSPFHLPSFLCLPALLLTATLPVSLPCSLTSLSPSSAPSFAPSPAPHSPPFPPLPLSPFLAIRAQARRWFRHGRGLRRRPRRRPRQRLRRQEAKDQ